MNLYKQCLELSKITHQYSVDQEALLPSVESSNVTLPHCLLPQLDVIGKLLCNRVFYISDVHLSYKVARKFKLMATDAQISRYVKKIAKDLVTGDLSDCINDYAPPIVIFGGDISSCFKISKIFYTEFVEQFNRLLQNSRHSGLSKRYIYAILGNHELWDFESLDSCCRAYHKLFNSLGICFLHNSISWFGDHRTPMKQTGTIGRRPVYVELQKADDEAEYNQQMRHIHNTLIIGGVGFAGCNREFNADMGLYRSTVNRTQEVEESCKWRESYQQALEMAKETNSGLIVLCHHPLRDWKEDGVEDSGCIYFTGHSHRNYLYHDEERNIHVFANNQIGYKNANIHFKEAYIYKRINPFANHPDGCHEILSSQYLRFYDYMKEHIEGNGLVEREIRTNNARFYMIKHSGYYGFFLVSSKGTYICAGGRIKKISKSPDIEQFHADFSRMIKQYMRILSPYRNAQEQLSEAVRSFGGDGTIHGCIIDIDFYNHIMLNPSDGAITYYYSPEFGQVEIYNDLMSLLENHNDALAAQYRKLLRSSDHEIMSQPSTTELIQIDIKNSVYAVSNRMNQLQRLFDKKILRDWNDDLLSNASLTDENLLPPGN